MWLKFSDPKVDDCFGQKKAFLNRNDFTNTLEIKFGKVIPVYNVFNELFYRQFGYKQPSSSASSTPSAYDR